MTFANSEHRPFFMGLDRFGTHPAFIDGATGEEMDYATLERRVAERTEKIGNERKLVFIEAKNDFGSIIDYLACLRGGHPVYIADDLQAPKAQELVSHYAPHILIDGNRQIVHANSDPITLHADLALLLSTSGSTGSPKFVKLSARNIDSNARAICEYLELDGAERALQHLKPHYSYGISIINSHLACGATLILTQHGVTDAPFWDTFKTFAGTSMAGVPYTFETLKHRGFNVEDYPSLRYVTQAGGKLEAHLVADFASKFAAAGRRFYVMYGQTEAAPRISYLPPALATQFPGSIGKAIPDGKLYLIDDAGREIEQPNMAGELAYEGPNVMMGYATCSDELATDETPPRLLTGDIAEIREDGLFFIVGRSSRFVKPFGVRVNLDELQSYIKQSHGTCAVTGDDKHIIIAVEGKKSAADAISIPDLMDRFGLPAHIFQVRPYATLPLLSSGKYDFQAILKGGSHDQSPPSFLGRIIAGVADILGLKQNNYASVTELYQGMLSDDKITENDSFKDLSVDSLSFVALAIEMETLFQSNLPNNWQDMSLKALEEHYQQSVARAAA